MTAPASCLEILKADPTTIKPSGKYRIRPTGSSADVEVFCDMDTMGGG